MPAATSLERLAVLVNPAAGGGRAGATWQRLLAAEPELCAVPTVEVAGLAAAADALRQLLAGEVDRLLVVGGDGTLHLAANCLLALGVADRVALGLVPAGTGSDLARSLALPRRPLAALRATLAAAPRATDVLRITTADGRREHAVNTISAGLSGLVVGAVNARPDRGASVFLRATLGALRRYRPLPCRILADGEPCYQGELLLLAVTNGRYFGNGMHVAPQADLTDGQAELIVVGPVPHLHLPLRLAQLYLGRHLHCRPVHYRRARHVRFEPLADFPPFELDGESFPAGPADLEVLPGALRVLVP